MEISSQLASLMNKSWVPSESAVLTFIIEKQNILLINKKTGMGKGLVNAPGGRIEPGESACEAAVRETKEEIGLDVEDLNLSGELFFQFIDGYSLYAQVFKTTIYSGSLCCTAEADPFWKPIDQIPFEKMWEDDKLWIPHMLEGVYFKGYFLFDGETMLEEKILTGEEYR